jgi:prepilin peptidase CpaA
MILVSLTGLLVSSVYSDFRTGKIYNRVTFSCMVLGIGLNTLAYGWHGLLDSLTGICIVLLTCMLLASLSCIGGGDIKLMMAAGSFLGLRVTIWAMTFTAIAGGVLALLVALHRRKMWSSLRNAAISLYLRLTAGIPVEQTLATGDGIRFKYSIAIACGVITALLYTNRMP